jgi:uncharacterized protein YdeI (YjbR/CyaY-like superfamily)
MIQLADAAAFESWLEANHDTADEIWVAIAKKGSGIPSITASEAIDVVLCFGWIDGHRKGLDEKYFLQRYSPRRARSAWSRVNVERVAVLLEHGRMRDSGLAEVARAKADGRWDAAYLSQAAFVIPEDVDPALLDGLGKTEQYLAVLPLLKARTRAGRERALTRLQDRTSARSPEQTS